MSQFFNDSIFWVEVDRISPNPYQPRREFDPARLQELADSIKMYGVLQPLVVSRKEVQREDGSFTAEYELLSGERRLRASKLAGLSQVPVLIRDEEQSDKEKLEIAIIENLQREDLNVVERARAFKQLAEDFGLTHVEIGRKVGKSRVYVSNTIRILALPEEMINALKDGKITEGHTRPLLMLSDRPIEQFNLFREIMQKKMSVRDAEGISRRIAYDRVKRPDTMVDPEICELEDKFKETLGTRVYIEKRQKGGKLSIDFFSVEDLRGLLDLLEKNKINTSGAVNALAEIAKGKDGDLVNSETINNSNFSENTEIPQKEVIGDPITQTQKELPDNNLNLENEQGQNILPEDDRSNEEKEQDESDLYSIKNFTV